METMTKLNVVAQKADPNAVIRKAFIKGWESTCINVMEDGTERPYRISAGTKKELQADLLKLPINNVRGIWVENGRVLLELFKYNGI